MKERQIIRNQVYVVLLALLFIVTLGFGAVSAEASTSRDNRMEQVVAPVSVEAVFGSPFRIHKEFTLEFNANGGSGKQSAVFSSNGSIKLPNCRYTKTGYHFTGWKIGTHVYSAGSDFPCDSYGSTTATAQWAANSYTIYFEANEGTGTQSSINTTYDKMVTLPACSFTRKGYTFAGWKIGNQVYSAGDKVKNLVPSGQVAATAQWKANTYTIAFAANGGTGTMSSITVKYDETKKLPKCAFSYTGSSFNVWKWNNQTYANEASVKNLTDKDGVTLTFTAQWKANSYTIAFGANGGTGTQSPINTTYGATVTLPECSFTRKGYTFAGWKINGTVYKAGARVKNLCTGGQVTATAQWKANTYKVTFMDGNTKVSTKDVTYGSTYGSLPNLTITGTGSSSRKARWFTKQKPGEGTEITAATKVTITSPQTLYAKWEMLVMFDINGGRGSNTSQAYLIGEVFGKLPSDPTPPNSSCRFDGWYTKAVGGTKIKTTTTVTSSHTKLYAHYVVNVKFDNNGGSGSIPNREYTIGSTYGSLPSGPTKSNYEFVCWRTGKDSGVEVTSSSTVPSPSTNGITLYASWRLKNPAAYNIPYNNNPVTKNDMMAHNFNSYPDLPSGKCNGYYIEFKATDAPKATYWSLCNWNMNLKNETESYTQSCTFKPPFGAYAGFQVLADGSTKLVFSMWDGVRKSDGKHQWPDFVSSDFKNGQYTIENVDEKKKSKEGTFTKCLFDYNWSAGNWYGMYLSSKVIKGETHVSMWVYDISNNKWTHVITVNTHLKNSYMEGSMYMFMENFSSIYREARRSCNLRNVHIHHVGQNWQEITSFTLKTDSTSYAKNKVGSFAFNSYNNYIWAYTTGKGPSTYGGIDKYNISFPASVKSGGKLPELPKN